MVRHELKQLLNGESAYLRERAPEPLLLPRIASRIAPQGLSFVAAATSILSRCWGPSGWPALADATAQVIASRHTELSDELLQELCDELPGLPLALIGLDEVAGRRVEVIFGSDTATRLKAGLGDSTFFLREAVSRVFEEKTPPHTMDELMGFVRDRSEYEGPELQRNLLAYFLPLAPATHQQWMIPNLVNVLGTYPDWSVAAAASRFAGLLDPDAIEQIELSLECADPWANHVRGLLKSSVARSAFEEVTRALPYDSRLETLLASETALASLADFADEILEGWGGSPPPKMEASRGMESFDPGDDAIEEELGAEPEESPPTRSASRGFNPDGMDDDRAEDVPRTGPSESKSAPPPPTAAAPAPERMLQAQISADDDGFLVPVRQGFKQGARHEVRLWIGPESKRGIKADKAISEPSPDSQELQTGSMKINITLAYGSKLESHQVELPIDRTKRSTVAEFSLDIEDDSELVSADVWLQHKGRIFQYLALNGRTFEEPDGQIDGIELKVETLIRGLPIDASGGNFEMAMVKKDDKYIVFGPSGAEKTEISLQGSGEFVEDINNRLFKATVKLVRSSGDKKGTSWVSDPDEEAMKLLRVMARKGNLLYDTLKKGGVLDRISETIQFVNLDESDIVPIEYVYDKGYPDKGATLCEGFREATDWNEIFAAGQCSCSNKPGVKSPTLCPMGFWSLSKIIERQPRQRGTANTQLTTVFSEPSAASPDISLARDAVFAAAPNVKSEDVDSVTSMLEETYPNHYQLASNWDEWETEIKEKSPKLLILLPHHGKDQENTHFLEIGSAGQVQGDKLHAGLLSENYVTKQPDEPGPVVLLLGCQTAQADQLPYHTFARDFLANRASIVVATQATVLGQHVAPVANEFVRQLLASTGGDGSFGTIMRDVRRKMFSAGYLVSMALISFGDSDWKLGNSTTGENDVPH
jgi:hypothetical protein